MYSIRSVIDSAMYSGSFLYYSFINFFRNLQDLHDLHRFYIEIYTETPIIYILYNIVKYVNIYMGRM